MNMQAEFTYTKMDFLGLTSSYKNALEKQTRVLNKLQARYRKALAEQEKIVQEVSLLNLQIEAQARLLRDL